MRILSVVFCLLLTCATAYADTSCDELARIRGLVATIEITVSNLNRANGPAPATSTYQFDDVGNWIRRVTMFSGSGVSEGTGQVETRWIVYQKR